jgi:hypothetical protein
MARLASSGCGDCSPKLQAQTVARVCVDLGLGFELRIKKRRGGGGGEVL